MPRMYVRRRITLSAPAKINLHLEITGRRGDGYHDLCSLFLMVSLQDRIQVAVKRTGTEIRFYGREEIDARLNTVRTALDLFRETTGFPDGVRVTVRKRIPQGSGLGGGSSDAATTLCALNRLCPAPLSRKKLMELGARIGSDVPFFFSAPFALVEGRGERVSPLSDPPRIAVLLIVPDFSVPTASAYRWYDEAIAGSGSERDHAAGSALPSSGKRLPLDTGGAPVWEKCFNSFDRVLKERHSVYGELEKRLVQAGALMTGPSGSGAAYFGVFRERRAAVRALADMDVTARLLQTVVPVTHAFHQRNLWGTRHGT
ncbi:MAG TPA: 4-(cytidine 5'-diphospho)-2-C-methyl-D-erythritol kinase [Spirochaetia bacterium]|nr:4-(cytidine 5'-diphospho)-2-C-methyl-D-erythritol kinase [Spirochaetia bacterium]